MVISDVDRADGMLRRDMTANLVCSVPYNKAAGGRTVSPRHV